MENEDKSLMKAFKEKIRDERNAFAKALTKLIDYRKNIWHDASISPFFNSDGWTQFIISSNYGHISGEAHCYDHKRWKNHIESQKYREFKWAYEKDLI